MPRCRARAIRRLRRRSDSAGAVGNSDAAPDRRASAASAARLGSAEWFAGVGFVAAMAAAFVAPVLQLRSVWCRRWASCTHHGSRLTGIVIAVIGIAATVYAQLDMGDSWRIGVDPSETTTLVRTGVFGWVRNPIFTAMMTFGFESRLVTPNRGRDRWICTAGRHDRTSGPCRRRAVPVDRARRRVRDDYLLSGSCLFPVVWPLAQSEPRLDCRACRCWKAAPAGSGRAKHRSPLAGPEYAGASTIDVTSSAFADVRHYPAEARWKGRRRQRRPRRCNGPASRQTPSSWC